MARRLALFAAASVALAPAQASTGPYPARIEANPKLRYHTIFRPVKLGAARLPVVLFAGGGCRNAGGRFRELLTEVASYGYVVVALGEVGNPAFDSNPKNEPEYAGRPTKTDVSQLDYAFAWVKAETARRASPYYGKLDARRIAVMGQSCGGVQAIDFAARHGDFATLVVLNSGTFADDQSLGGSKVKRAELGTVRVPTLILLGGKGDIAYLNGQGDYDRMVNAPAMVASADYGHTATYFQKDGGLFARVVVDWLRWQLRGDATASRRFTGPACGLCTDKQWTVRSRGLETLNPRR